jgi:uncharacterized repeat protein (TIGR03803 family)
MKPLGYIVGACLAAILLTACGGAHDATTPVGGNGQPAVPSGVRPSAQLATVYEFQGPPSDGGSPFGSLTLGSDGNFYGTTFLGGVGARLRHDIGTVFEITPAGVERVLHTFQGGADGAAPEAGVTEGSGGVLYGVTQNGGGSAACAGGCGIVYALVPNGSDYTEHVLHAFQGGSDGAVPLASVLLDGQGNIYGTTIFGGGASCTSGSVVVGCGTVFKLTPNGSSYSESVLYAFQGGSDGAFAAGSLIRDRFGRLYGATEFGGGTSCTLPPNPAGCGIAFMISSKGHESILYRFQGGTGDGSVPRSALLPLKGFQRLVGATLRGGSAGCNCGTVYELKRSSSGYAEKVLYNFGGYATDAIRPGDQEGLVADAQGNIFGTGNGGGAACFCGAVFELSPSVSGYTERVLASFKGGDGSFPHDGVTSDGNGQLYGATYQAGLRVHGCAHGCGTIFRVTP